MSKHPLAIKYMTGIFDRRPPNRKLSNVWDFDILFRYFQRLGEKDFLLEKVLNGKLFCAVLIAVLLLLAAHRHSTICIFTFANTTYNFK